MSTMMREDNFSRKSALGVKIYGVKIRLILLNVLGGRKSYTS